mmetsp:Transcript_1774/g.6391  ORF Transcript_1774/g.6391 Transcript_1774/m.6391 type:complete len:216 (-) Transcript_1774:81-728(-)
MPGTPWPHPSSNTRNDFDVDNVTIASTTRSLTTYFVKSIAHSHSFNPPSYLPFTKSCDANEYADAADDGVAFAPFAGFSLLFLQTASNVGTRIRTSSFPNGGIFFSIDNINTFAPFSSSSEENISTVSLSTAFAKTGSKTSFEYTCFASGFCIVVVVSFAFVSVLFSSSPFPPEEEEEEEKKLNANEFVVSPPSILPLFFFFFKTSSSQKTTTPS